MEPWLGTTRGQMDGYRHPKPSLELLSSIDRCGWFLTSRDRVVRLFLDNGTMTAYMNWPSGFVPPVIERFVGAVFDGESMWMIPFRADRIVRMLPRSNGSMVADPPPWPLGGSNGRAWAHI